MTAKEIIDSVHEIDALEAEEAEAEKAAVARRERIARLRSMLNALAEPADRRRVPDALILAIRGRKRESPRQDAIRALILKKRDIGYRGLVEAVYGQYTKKAVLNMRSIVSNMKAAGQLSGEPGSWRVSQPQANAADVPSLPFTGQHIDGHLRVAGHSAT